MNFKVISKFNLMNYLYVKIRIKYLELGLYPTLNKLFIFFENYFLKIIFDFEF